MLYKLESEYCAQIRFEINHVRCFVQSMPEAAGAVAAAAVADRLLGVKERRQLAIVLVSFNHLDLHLGEMSELYGS